MPGPVPFSPRERAISQILLDVFGPDPDFPEHAAEHYHFDVSLLNLMLDASPSEEHLLDFFGIQQPEADVERIRTVTRRLLALASASCT